MTPVLIALALACTGPAGKDPADTSRATPGGEPTDSEPTDSEPTDSEPTDPNALTACEPIAGATSAVLGTESPPVPAENLHVWDMAVDPAADRMYVAGTPGLWMVDTSTVPATSLGYLAPKEPSRSFRRVLADGDELTMLDDLGHLLRMSIADGFVELESRFDVDYLDVVPGFYLSTGDGLAAAAGPDGTVHVLQQEVVQQLDAERAVMASWPLPEAAYGSFDLAWDDVSGALLVAAGSEGTFVLWPDGRVDNLPTAGSAVQLQASGGLGIVADVDGVVLLALDEPALRVIGHWTSPTFAIGATLDAVHGRAWVGDQDVALPLLVDLDASPPVAIVPSVADDDGGVEVANAGGSELLVGTPGQVPVAVAPGESTRLVPNDGCVVTSDPERGVVEVWPAGTDTSFPVGVPAPDLQLVDVNLMEPVSLAESTWLSTEPPPATLVVFWASW